MLKNELRLLLSGKTIKDPGNFRDINEIYTALKPPLRNLDKELDYIEKTGIDVIDYFCDEYPEELRKVEYPPLVLFIRGKLKRMELPIAIVGTRHPSGYGQRVAKYLVPYLVKAGFSIISGMARGIDAISHREAMDANGYTVAVLGSGIDVVYPPENKTLYSEIVKNGCVISEFPLHTKPLRYNFPRRNRIIAALSSGVVVIEADLKSGSLITARIAEELSKPVFAVPGEIFSKRSRGTNLLISRGAIPVNDIDAILSYFYIELKRKLEEFEKEIESPETETEKLVLDSMEGRMSIDEISLKTGIDIPQLTDLLFDLELKGFIRRTATDTYEKT